MWLPLNRSGYQHDFSRASIWQAIWVTPRMPQCISVVALTLSIARNKFHQQDFLLAVLRCGAGSWIAWDPKQWSLGVLLSMPTIETDGSSINRHLIFCTGPDSAPCTATPASHSLSVVETAELIILAWCREAAGKCLKVIVCDAKHSEFCQCLSNNFIWNVLGKDIVRRNSYHGYNSNILKHLIKGIMCIRKVFCVWLSLMLLWLMQYCMPFCILILNIYIYSKKVGENAGRISTDTGITFECLMLY